MKNNRYLHNQNILLSHKKVKPYFEDVIIPFSAIALAELGDKTKLSVWTEPLDMIKKIIK